MPIIDRYRQIQTNLAKKKEQKQNLQLSEEQARLATEKFGAEKVNQALGTVQNAGVGVQNTETGKVLPPVTPPVVNNEPTTPEITPQAQITPEPTPTPVVEPIKEEVKPTEQPKPTEKPMTLEETAKQADSWIAQAPPKGFQYGNVIDPKTGLPQLVNTAELKRQKELKKNASIYTSGQALYDGIKSGSILPGTDSFSDLQQANPQVFAEYEALKKQEEAQNKINNVGKMIMGDPIETKPSQTLQDLLDKVSSGLDEDIGTMYKNMVTNNEEYVAANKKVTDLSNQLATVENQMNTIGDELRKTITGETPEQVIASKIARDAKPLLDKATYLQNQLEIAQSDANRIMADNKGMFEIQMADRADKRNLAFKLYDTINADEIRQEDIARENDRITKEIALEEYRYQRELADGNAIRAEERKNKLEDLKTEHEYNLGVGLMQLGVDPTGLTPEEMTREYANAARKAQQAAAQAEGLKTQIELAKLAKGNWKVESINGVSQLVNQETGETKPLSSAVSSQGLAVPAIQSFINQCRTTGQCGAGANDYLQKLGEGRLMGDSYASKSEDINSQVPVAGSVAIWNPAGDNLGHAGIVLEDRGDTVLIRDWNWAGDEQQATHEVPKSSISATGGYYIPNKIKEAQIPSQQTTIITAIDELMKHPGLKAAVGVGFQKLLPGNQADEGFLPASDAEDFRTKFMSFRDNIVLPNLELLKGAMSDNDIKFIRSAGTAASLNMSEKAFKAELSRIQNNIYKKFGIDPNAKKDPLKVIGGEAQTGNDPLGIL